MAINYANYELSFGTVRGDILFRRHDNEGMDVLIYQNGDICPHMVAFFENDEWAEFCAVFNNRYGRGWSPNALIVDPSLAPLNNTYEESSEESSPESS